jgi:hypothetical protein
MKAARPAQTEVVTQLVAIVCIFVTAHQLIHALADQLFQAVGDFVWLSPLLDTLCQSLAHLQLCFGLPSQQNPSI